jgi:outer membrane biosynthesis protein TonB
MVDAKGTSFGAYDAAFIDAVSQHWRDLLDARNYAGEGSGKVVLRFHLKYDGTISDLEVAETSVNTILTYLCQQAIHDPAPFERWPREMRLMIGSDSRPIQFTFFYN